MYRVNILNSLSIVKWYKLIEKHTKQLRTRVFAILGGIPLPFLGVDGTSACGHVFLKDGTTKAGCPLKANNEYVYKNQFDVLAIYPTVSKVTY